MATTAATLDILVNARTQSATSSLRRMDASAKQSSTHLSNLDRTSGRLTGTLSRVGKAALAAGAGYVSLQAAKTAVNNTEELAKATLSLNQNMGFTQKTAVELATTLKVRGADAKQTSQAFATFSGVLNQASEGSASAIQKFNQLGIGGKRLQSDLKNPQQALMDVSDGLKNVGAGVVRTDAQRKLFGRGWQQLSPILRGGSKALKENLDEAKPVFDAFGGEGVNSIKDLIKAQRDMQIQMLALEVSFTKNLAPALISTMGFIGKLIGFFRGLFQVTNQMGPSIGEVVKWTKNAANNFAHWISTTGTLAESFHRLIKLINQLIGVFFAVGKAAIQAGKWIVGAFGTIGGAVGGAINVIKKAWGGITHVLTAPFAAAVGIIQGFINAIIDAINVLPGVNIGHVGGGGDASGGGHSSPPGSAGGGKGGGSKGLAQSHKRQRGGGMFVGGSGSGDKVPAMLEPGEFVLNRNAVSAIGLSNVSRLNKDIPRFQAGGVASALGQVAGKALSGGGGVGGNLPGIGGLPDWIQPTGSYVLAKVGDFIKKKAASLVPNVGGDLLLQTNTPAQVAKVLNTGVGFGKSHAGGPYTWGGGHAGFSGPYDCSGYVSAILHSMGMLGSPQTTDGLKGWGAAGPGKYMTVGVRGTTGRNAHTMMRIGNLFFESGGGHGAAVEGGWDGSFPIKRHWPGLAEGGTVMDVLKRHKIKLGPKSFDPNSSEFIGWGLQSGGRVPNPKHGAHWIKDLGSHVDANEAATLLWQAGLSEADAGALSRVVPGESGGNVMAHNASGATGLFQILGSVFPGNLYDPRINAINAAIKWRTQGRGAWEAADSGTAGHILRDRVGAVARGRTTKTPKAGKKGGGGGGGGGSSAFDDALQAFHDINDPRIGSMNELIGEGNLEALQRYQVGASQNPILGLGKPGFPSPQALLSTDPTLDDIIGIDKQVYAPGGGPFTQLPAKHQDWGGTAGFQNRPVHHHTHVHVDGKEVAHVVHKENKKEARRGRRPLPSSRRQ